MKDIWKEVKKVINTVLLCVAVGVACYLYGTLHEMSKHDDTYFASKIEKGEKIEWMGHTYKEVKN